MAERRASKSSDGKSSDGKSGTPIAAAAPESPILGHYPQVQHVVADEGADESGASTASPSIFDHEVSRC